MEKTISEKSKGDGDAIRHLEAEELADENQLSEEDTPNHPVDTRYYLLYPPVFSVRRSDSVYKDSSLCGRDFGAL